MSKVSGSARSAGSTPSLPRPSNGSGHAEQETAHLDKLHLTVALSYGGRAEIVDAVRKLVHDAQDGKLQPRRCG